MPSACSPIWANQTTPGHGDHRIMTIYLHIGSHKTGTTSIQKLLSRHRDTLAAQGIWYPRDSELLDGAHDSGAHLNIARSLDNNHRRKFYSASDLAKIFEALTSKSRSFHTTIISAEAFWRIGFIKPPKGHAKAMNITTKPGKARRAISSKSESCWATAIPLLSRPSESVLHTFRVATASLFSQPCTRRISIGS